eukprot:GFUD01128219.1.p1 GENE.GFUD01128219.1~~GFUD01128219.1.p1  ORF type:complete len:318 (+),score=97.41 GFUD01128219.1:52-1005(+)
MVTKLQVLMSVLPCILVTAEKPTVTSNLPVMEALSDDPDHVLVDYAGCFDIQDFRLIDTVSVHVGRNNVGVATRDPDFNKSVLANSQQRVFQTLVENAKIKAKLPGCKSHKFYVKITFKDKQDNKLAVNSLTADYAPESFKALINFEICMKNNSLFLPLDAMKKSHPQFAACLEQIYIKGNKGNSKQPLQDGLNSLENVETSIDIVIQQKVGTFDLQVDMEVFNQKTCSALGFDVVTLALVIVSSVLGVVVLVVVAWCVCKKKKREVEEKEIVDMNPEYGADYQDDKESELKDTNDYYFYAKEGDNIEVTDTNEYYD